jgi:hypothetical protein
MGYLGERYKMPKAPDGQIKVRIVYDPSWGVHTAGEVGKAFGDFILITPVNLKRLQTIMQWQNKEIEPLRKQWQKALGESSTLVSKAVFEMATDTSQSSFYSQGKEKFYENLAKQQCLLPHRYKPKFIL